MLVVSLDFSARAVEVQAFEVDENGNQHGEDVAQHCATDVQNQRKWHFKSLQ